MHELVKHGRNGLIFNAPEELAKQVEDLLDGFPTNTIKLDQMRNEIKSFQQVRWADNWTQYALPVFS